MSVYFLAAKPWNTMLLVCVDAFFKFVWLLPFRKATKKAVIKDLKERIFAIFSVPEIIVIDDVTCYRPQHFKEFCFTLGVIHITTSPFLS